MPVLHPPNISSKEKSSEKAFIFSTLMKHEFPIPEFFVITDVKEQVAEAKISDTLKENIIKAYKKLEYGKTKEISGAAFEFISAGRDPPFVCVRGEETFFNIRGDKSVVETVQQLLLQNSEQTIIVQKMVNAEKSGFALGQDEVAGHNRISIEAGWGLASETLDIKRDYYTVDKINGTLINAIIGNKPIMITRNIYTGETKEKNISSEQSVAQVLDESEVRAVAARCKLIEDILGKPQRMSFAFERNKLYITNCKSLD